MGTDQALAVQKARAAVHGQIVKGGQVIKAQRPFAVFINKAQDRVLGVGGQAHLHMGVITPDVGQPFGVEGILVVAHNVQAAQVLAAGQRAPLLGKQVKISFLAGGQLLAGHPAGVQVDVAGTPVLQVVGAGGVVDKIEVAVVQLHIALVVVVTHLMGKQVIPVAVTEEVVIALDRHGLQVGGAEIAVVAVRAVAARVIVIGNIQHAVLGKVGAQDHAKVAIVVQHRSRNVGVAERGDRVLDLFVAHFIQRAFVGSLRRGGGCGLGRVCLSTLRGTAGQKHRC